MGASSVQEKLRQLLSGLEERIDMDHVEKTEQLHLDAIHFREVPFLPLTVIVPAEELGYEAYPYAEAHQDPDKMLYNELLKSFASILTSMELGDWFPYHIRSNHGLGIISSVFGAECRILGDNMPWVEPLGDIEAVLEHIRRGPDFAQGLPAKVLDTHRHFQQRLAEYPKCSRAIRLSQPDLQGPFDNAHLLLGSDIFYQVYDEPEALHEILQAITDAYAAYRRMLEPCLSDMAGAGDMYIHGAIYRGRILIKDDTAVINLSPAQYEEFSGRYNKQLFDAFTGSLHYCGKPYDWTYTAVSVAGPLGFQFGNPELHSFPEEFGAIAADKRAVVQWGVTQGYEFIRQSTQGIGTGITCACTADTLEEARRVLEEHQAGATAV